LYFYADILIFVFFNFISLDLESVVKFLFFRFGPNLDRGPYVENHCDKQNLKEHVPRGFVVSAQVDTVIVAANSLTTELDSIEALFIMKIIPEKSAHNNK
jgi:hypothetical protein